MEQWFSFYNPQQQCSLLLLAIIFDKFDIVCGTQKSLQEADEVDRHHGVDCSHLIPVIPSGCPPERRVKWFHSVTSTKSHPDYNMQAEVTLNMSQLMTLYKSE